MSHTFRSSAQAQATARSKRNIPGQRVRLNFPLTLSQAHHVAMGYSCIEKRAKLREDPSACGTEILFSQWRQNRLRYALTMDGLGGLHVCHSDLLWTLRDPRLDLSERNKREPKQKRDQRDLPISSYCLSNRKRRVREVPRSAQPSWEPPTQTGVRTVLVGRDPRC